MTNNNIFSSNHNYKLDSGGSNMTGISVTVNVTETLICDNDFAFQLNAWLPNDSEYDSTWQQYGVSMIGTEITGWYDIFVGDGIDRQCLVSVYTMSNANSNILPEGYSINITLQYDSTDIVTGVVYTVMQGSTLLGTQTLIFTDNSTITAADLSPIEAIELDIVGHAGGANVSFSSGTGTITYAATSDLTVVDQLPENVKNRNSITAETSNMGYGSLNMGGNPMPLIQQTFSI